MHRCSQDRASSGARKLAMRLHLCLVGLLLLAGCTTFSLEHYTLGQSATAIDLRYHEVLANLALIADDPCTLPAYSTIFTGTAQVSDTAQLSATTTLQTIGGKIGNGFGSQNAAPQLTRNISENWALDPLVTPEKLEAMRCACRWVLFGPAAVSGECAELLAGPEQAPTPGRHFGVADRLAALPTGWLHHGKLHHVPPGACYKAHCRGTWVWVMPDGIKGLAEFTLILQEIAHVNINSLTVFVVQPTPSDFSFLTTPLETCGPDGKPMTVKVAAVVPVNCGLEIVPNLPYYRLRLDNVGSDAHLRSQISAAGVAPGR
jgi:hypothetical protein